MTNAEKLAEILEYAQIQMLVFDRLSDTFAEPAKQRYQEVAGAYSDIVNHITSLNNHPPTFCEDLNCGCHTGLF